ncbi:probable G-protein coupled receptor 179 [Dipodomys merriami]|uniref:probable G-protein coupled receptor 179 n=1 Tax=Dipodomys merriami TaxID=94247 RepID=UPI003855CCCE
MGTRAVVMRSSVWGLLGFYFLSGWALGGPRLPRSLPPLSSQAKPGSVSAWELPQGAEAALAFLYSGEAQQLLGANCSERFEAHGAEAKPRLPPILQRAAGTLTQAANFLNMLLQANDIRESSVEEDVEWYQALVRSVAEGDPRAYRALLTFNPPPGASHLQLALQATRMGEETILQDLSGNRVQEENPAGDMENPNLQKRVLTNDLRSLNSPKWPRGDGYVGDIQQVRLSPPFLECQEGRLRPGWLVTLTATFYGLKPDLSPEVRGQVQMDIDLQSVDINQCASGPGWYSNTHLCDLNSTQCVPLESQGFVLGRYLCHCRPGFYGASGSGGLESATQTTKQFGSPQSNSGKLLRCQPCSKGCTSCRDATPCLVEEAPALRAAVLACQACFMLAVFLSMLVSYRCRWSKRIRASGVVLLEAILFGSLLLYFPVFILYFKPSVFRCIALRWVRLLGFAIVYGTVILKLYRVLQLFLSRTAQRGPHLSSGQLLRRLGLLLLLVLGFLCVWTAGVLERGTQHIPLVTRGHTPTGRHFYLCHHDRWDYIMVVAEILLLCWGSFLCYATWAVPSAFHEPRYMGIALHNELLLSAAFHTARFVLVPSLNPDWTLLLFFFHTHSTVTATLALIFIPKFQKPGAPPREEILDEVYEDELDLQRSGSYLNSSIASAWSERSLDPGDIRDELKKLYAQLEVRKTKEMAANNPHLPKKRGSSRQGLGRSFMRYLAEFPESLTRQHSRDSGSPGRSSLPGSSRRRLLSSSIQEAEGAPALHKSCSTYDQGEPDSPLLNSLLRRNLSKKASHVESQESVDGPPALGFRSASAHNLTVGERLPRARPVSLQKSLSVVTGSREKALLVASQAYLEESYRQAKEREERKKAELAIASPVRRPSARRLERAPGAPLSAPPSPAKSSSIDSSHMSGRLREEAGRKLPHPPIRHQVSTPILALSGACLGEPRMLSPTSTLAPALMPALAPTPTPVLAPVPVLAPTPTPVLAPVPVVPQSPSLLTYICPWENAELPVKKENVVQENPPGPERGGHSSAPARAKLWRALSVAVDKKGAGENEIDTEDGRFQGEADVDEDRPKISKSHSLKTPVQQGSMRSLGLAIKALTRSRSTYREKEGGEGSPEKKDRPTGSGMGVSLRSPRLGRPKGVSKQAALAPCDDEESLQNQQNVHTSRMLQVCHQEGSREQEDQGLGERKVERASKTGLATLKQIWGDKHAEQTKEAIVGCQELPNAGLQSLGSADSKVAEVCPWEVTESETCQPDSSDKTKICPWEESEGGPERKASRQDLGDSQDKMGKAPEKSEPRGVVVIARKKPERLVRGQEAVCPWESADPGGVSHPSAPQDSDRMQGRSGEVGSVETRAETHQGEAPGPGACSPNTTKAELCPPEVRDGQGGTLTQRVKELPQERQKAPKKATFWSEQKLAGNLESLCPWESTDFRGPMAVSLPASGSPGQSGSWGSGIVEVCPWEAGEMPANRKAEVCPWDTGDERREEETLNQGASGESLRHKDNTSRKGILGEVEEKIVEAVPTGNQQQESVLKPEKKEATPATAEICPWEVDDATENWTLRQTPKGGVSQMDKEKMPGKTGIEDVTAWKKSEEQNQKQQTVCPWESVASGSFPTKDTERPGSMGSKATEICPWDIEDTWTAEKAKICPWEVDAGVAEEKTLGDEAIRKSPNDTQDTDSGPSQTAVPAPKKPERPALKQEVVCPGEGLSPGGFSQHPDTPHTDRPKPELQELAHVGCKPADVCPWEVEEAPTSEKVKICPWEINEGATKKELEQEMNELAREEDKMLENRELTSQEGGISKQEAKLQEQKAICPWEDTDLREPSAQTPKGSVLPSSTGNQLGEGHSSKMSDKVTEKRDLRQDPKTGSLPEHVTPGKASALTAEVVTQDGGKTSNNELQSVCPWESMVTAGSSSQTASQFPDQPTVSTQNLVNTGSRVAEVCPWDVPVLDKYKPDSSTKAEICPWEVTEQISEKRASKQDRKEEVQETEKALDKPESKGVAVQKMTEMADPGKQEAVCSGESQDQGSLSSTSSRSKGSSETAGCMGASMAEVCPWEAEEVPSARKEDICPWEVNTGAAEGEGEGEGGLRQDRGSQGQGEEEPRGTECSPKAAAKLSSESATVCSRESTGSGIQQEALDTDNEAKVSPDGASSMRRIAELCQWEVTDPEGNKIKGTMADICPWEVTRAPSEESGFLALTATATENVCPSSEQSLCLLVHRPLDSFFPDFKSSHPEVSEPWSTFTPEGVIELQGPSGRGSRTNLAPNSSLQEAEGQKSSHLTEDQGQVASQAQDEELGPPPTYPWDWEQ